MVIRKGKHYASRNLLPAFRIGTRVDRRRVMFPPSCRYDIGKDQTDVNKLYGVAYVSFAAIIFVLKSYLSAIANRDLKLVKSLHHYNSVRFGWWYNPIIDKIEFYSYCYNKGERSYEHLASIPFSMYVDCVINPLDDYRHELKLFKETGYLASMSVQVETSWLSYELGPYFGGDIPAPHDFQIFMQTL